MNNNTTDPAVSLSRAQAVAEFVVLGIFLLCAILQARQLARQERKVRWSWLLPQKIILCAAYLLTHACIAVSSLARPQPYHVLSASLLIFQGCGYLAMAVLSVANHLRSFRPSTCITIYLTWDILLDVFRDTNTLSATLNQPLQSLLGLRFVLRILLLASELTEKRGLILQRLQPKSPESTAGTFNHALFLWLNDLILQTFRERIDLHRLPPLVDDLDAFADSSELSHDSKQAALESKSDNALAWSVGLRFRWAFLAGIIPRLFCVMFTLAQPYVMKLVLDFVSDRDGQFPSLDACQLILVYATVYFGLSLSRSLYEYQTLRLITKIRGVLISLVAAKALRLPPATLEDTEVPTLISADIERMDGLNVFHDTYASLIEGGFALWLLFHELGIAALAPVAWMMICLMLGTPLANASANAQMPWLEAIQTRLSTTACMLETAKPMRMTGYADLISSRIRQLRRDEVQASQTHRIFGIFTYMWQFTSSGLAPILGFGLYTYLVSGSAETLTEGKAFAALGLFELLEGPLAVAITSIEAVRTVANSTRRIQEYLEQDEVEEHRGIEVENPEPLIQMSMHESSTAAHLCNISTSLGEDGPPILHDLSISITAGCTTMLVGPVGSGKSTLLRLLLGEARPRSGTISTNFRQAAYCPQKPWISEGSVQQNIIGQSPLDEQWYDIVIEACQLAPDFESLPDGDRSSVGSGGARLSGGQQQRVSLARALYSRCPTVILDDPFTGLDRETKSLVESAVLGRSGLLKRIGSTVILATSSTSSLRFADCVLILNEDGQAVIRDSSPAFEEVIDTVLETDQQHEAEPQKQLGETFIQRLNTEKAGVPSESSNVYGFYLRHIGPWTTGAYLAFNCTIVFGVTFPSVWLQWWTNANEQNPNRHVMYWLSIYLVIVLIAIVGSCLTDSIMNLIIIPRAAYRFHDLLLSTTMRATTYFLSSISTGDILNRFSEDLDLIDSELPAALDSLIFQTILAITSIVLVGAGSPYVLAAMPLCLLVLSLIQIIYLRTSRQLRMLDLEARAPLLSHLLDVVVNSSAIRAYGWSGDYHDKGLEVLDRSQRAYYLRGCAQHWLALVLDLFDAGLAVLLVTIATLVPKGSTGVLGVALFNVLTLSSAFQRLITEWTGVEIAMMAIKRVQLYISQVEDENLPDEMFEPLEDWPVKGSIDFTNSSMSNRMQSSPIIRGMSVRIDAGEKVAICGRTGSGKSSLIASLLRMLEITEGSIQIDGMDISTVPRELIRHRITTVPQEAFFFPSKTLRENLDPRSIASDEDMIRALRSVQLWDLVTNPQGLDGELSAETLSFGQRQLFNLARALIRPSKIVLLDEVASGVDADGAALIHDTIRSAFSECTILNITHRLDAIMEYDKVLVLNHGRLIEEGNPRQLLQTDSSAFRALFEAAGGSEIDVCKTSE